jgi:hypothetical protein
MDMRQQLATKAIKRLEYLGKMIGKYQHRWSENPSDRLAGWVDEYNDIRDEQPEAFAQYCEAHGFSKEHDGYDALA